MRLSEEDVAKDLTAVAGFADNAEKLAWRRKLKKMEDFLEELCPIEDEIIELYIKKQPIMDKVQKLRKEMAKECIHPKEYLVHRGTHVECKFCNKLIKPAKKKDA